MWHSRLSTKQRIRTLQCVHKFIGMWDDKIVQMIKKFQSLKGRLARKTETNCWLLLPVTNFLKSVTALMILELSMFASHRKILEVFKNAHRTVRPESRGTGYTKDLGIYLWFSVFSSKLYVGKALSGIPIRWRNHTQGLHFPKYKEAHPWYHHAGTIGSIAFSCIPLCLLCNVSDITLLHVESSFIHGIRTGFNWPYVYKMQKKCNVHVEDEDVFKKNNLTFNIHQSRPERAQVEPTPPDPAAKVLVNGEVHTRQWIAAPRIPFRTLLWRTYHSPISPAQSGPKICTKIKSCTMTLASAI